MSVSKGSMSLDICTQDLIVYWAPAAKKLIRHFLLSVTFERLGSKTGHYNCFDSFSIFLPNHSERSHSEDQMSKAIAFSKPTVHESMP